MRKNKRHLIQPLGRVEATTSSKKCPMCGTQNDQDAKACKYCGYIFEDFSSAGMNNPVPRQSQSSSLPPADMPNVPPATSTGTPLFVASKSILASLAPGIFYLAFIFLINSATSFSVYSVGLIALFIAVGFVPILFTSRKYEFYDGSLRMVKIIGGSSEIPYSDMVIHDSPAKRKPRIVLSAVGQRRPFMIPGNPTNEQLGEDLNQFLHKKLKTYDPHAGKQEQPSPSSEEPAENTDDDAVKE
ncbi:MAG: zinc ribbon domain-containing protein [Nitrososphaerales archaeon]